MDQHAIEGGGFSCRSLNNEEVQHLYLINNPHGAKSLLTRKFRSDQQQQLM